MPISLRIGRCPVLKPAVILVAMSVSLHCFASEQSESVCFGTPSNGRLENGWNLPANGKNFMPYSSLGQRMGRTYVHSKVYRTMLDAYAELAGSRPNTVYVYGETGNRSGGPFRPHKTHRNG